MWRRGWRSRACRRRSAGCHPGKGTSFGLPGAAEAKGRRSWSGSWTLTRRAVAGAAWPYFGGGGTRRQAVSLSALLVALLLLENVIGVVFGIFAGSYMTALQKRDAAGFYTGLQRFAGLIGVSLVVGTIKGLTRAALGYKWTQALTRHLGRMYLVGGDGVGQFYQLTLSEDVDNPDQRITGEASSFVEKVLDLVSGAVSNAMKLVSFGGVLFSISRHVFVGTIGYTVFGTAVTLRIFGSCMTRLQHEKLAKEARLRYSLIRVRENAESIAFFRGGGSEWLRFQDFYDDLLTTVRQSVLLNQCFGTFLHSFGWATFAVGPLMVGPAYLRGEAEFGAITTATMAFNNLLQGLSFFVNRFGDFAELAVHAQRVQGLEEALAQGSAAQSQAKSGAPGGITLEEVDAAVAPGDAEVSLEFQDFALWTPSRHSVTSQRMLLEGVSLKLTSGNSLLIAGASGIGKSSLLRAIAGLWREGRGRIRRCGGSAVFFLPQKPYMFLGTLREQLLYPRVQDSAPDLEKAGSSGACVGDAAILEALGEVGLDYLVERYGLDGCEAWAAVLSLGEQQRVAFARALLQPDLRLALIDEGTSACDPASEARLYGLLTSRLWSHVSVGHRPALQRFHSHALWLRRPSELQPPGEVKAATGCLAAADGPAVCSFLPMAEYQLQLRRVQEAEGTVYDELS